MGELQSKRFDEPDEVVSVPNLTGQIVVLGEVYVVFVGAVLGPRWSWLRYVRPSAGIPGRGPVRYRDRAPRVSPPGV